MLVGLRNGDSKLSLGDAPAPKLRFDVNVFGPIDRHSAGLYAVINMSYKLKLSDRLDRGVRRIGLEQIDAAIGHLRSDGETSLTVHATRKCLKKLRSLLRMVRPGLSAAVFERENARFRDIARQLSDLRDSHVLVATLDGLKTSAEGRTKPALEAAAKQLGRAQAIGGDVAADAAALLADAAGQLDVARTGFATLEIDGGFDTAFSGAADCYRKARRSMDHAFTTCDPDDLHEFRKAAQYHWRHMHLLSAAWPEYFEARATTARKLSMILGDDHDLAILAAVMSAPDGARGLRLSAQRRGLILSMIETRQSELQMRALRLSQQLFADPPGGFRDTIAFHWTTALDSWSDAQTDDGGVQNRGKAQGKAESRAVVAE